MLVVACEAPGKRPRRLLPVPPPPAGSHRDHGPQMSAALYDPAKNQTITLPDFALRSGPRKTIYHNPKDVTAAIVTCACNYL